MTRSALILCALALAGSVCAAGQPGSGRDLFAPLVLIRTPAAGFVGPDTTGTVIMPARLTRTPRRDLWFGKDKADHLVVSAFAVGLGYYAARKELHLSDPGSKNSGAVFSFSLGLLKELRDRRRRGNFFSCKDLTADVIGIGVGYLFCSIGDR
jgi:uncharacterized protein YfiM (DUF2279 family)